MEEQLSVFFVCDRLFKKSINILIWVSRFFFHVNNMTVLFLFGHVYMIRLYQDSMTAFNSTIHVIEN